MITVEHMEAYGFPHAIRGMRNPKNSWKLSDSHDCTQGECDGCPYEGEPRECNSAPEYVLGENDLKLLLRLTSGGEEHRKVLRQFVVWCDITAPLYWWKEADTYKVGTTANSCSTMHKIASKPFTAEDFSIEHLAPRALDVMDAVIFELNSAREAYLNWDKMTKEEKEDYFCTYYNDMTEEEIEKLSKKDVWWQMIQLLPTSYNQRRTVSLNYEVILKMLHQRKNHKLDEWNKLREIFLTLPYMKEIYEASQKKSEET